MSEPIRAVALDVDGVLTDNTFTWGPNGEEFKRFSFADVMGISRTRRLGIAFALISGEDSPLVTRFAAKVGIENVYLGCKDKVAALRQFANSVDSSAAAIAFMGNDVNDIDAMRLSGLAAAPADAHPSAIRVAQVVTVRKGGEGAVRELLDALFLDPAVQT